MREGSLGAEWLTFVYEYQNLQSSVFQVFVELSEPIKTFFAVVKACLLVMLSSLYSFAACSQNAYVFWPASTTRSWCTSISSKMQQTTIVMAPFAFLESVGTV